MAEVFEEGPLLVVVRRVNRGSVSLGIEAPCGL
jgi:hypothetical protein